MPEIETLQITLRGEEAQRFAVQFAKAVKRSPVGKLSKTAFGKWCLMRGVAEVEGKG